MKETAAKLSQLSDVGGKKCGCVESKDDACYDKKELKSIA